MGVTLQDFHGVTVSDVIKANPIGSQDLITHFYAVLLCKTTRVQPEKADGEKEKKHSRYSVIISTVSVIECCS